MKFRWNPIHLLMSSPVKNWSKNLRGRRFGACLSIWVTWTASLPAFGYSANKVSFEARPNGIYRVYINYTVPALKEFRDAFVEFYSRKEAEAFYYDLMNGADFYPDKAERREFRTTPRQPSPW